MNKIPRRRVVQAAVVCGAGLTTSAASAKEQAASSNSSPSLPAVRSCFSNLNQTQRKQFTKHDDLIGRRRFAFLDTRQIRDLRHVDHEFHAAEKVSDPVFTADPKLELGVGLYGSVLHDGKKFRMWYQPIGLNRQGGNSYAVAYAESTDGVNWNRPKLGVVPFKGNRRNSLVDLRGHGPSVIDLGSAAPPERRYLGIAVGFGPKLGRPEVARHKSIARHHGYWMYRSADGYRWHLYPAPSCAIFSMMSDTACFVGDPYRQQIIGSVKLEPRVGLYDRRSITISTTPSNRLSAWQESRLALFPDELDDRMAADRGSRFAEIYGMGLLAQRDTIIGFPEVYWVDGKLHPHQSAGIRLGYHGKTELQMAYSYDGHAWHRSRGRKPFIALGKKGDWDDGFLTMQGSAVEVGDDVFCFYSGNRGGHSSHYDTMRRQIGLAKIKRDRFASLTAGKKSGLVEVFHGQRDPKTSHSLKLNVRTEGKGRVLVEARIGSGKRTRVVPGFSKLDCNPIQGNDVGLEVTWRSKGWKNLPANVPLVLRFYLDKAQLFAYET